mmetsp:Transcript_19784/g.35901  ORF Transcript_19784/g.35901 Transcript_19784/m.35901 type:complete len:115 (-) Transcript_19784:977-1321(-)
MGQQPSPSCIFAPPIMTVVLLVIWNPSVAIAIRIGLVLAASESPDKFVPKFFNYLLAAQNICLTGKKTTSVVFSVICFDGSGDFQSLQPKRTPVNVHFSEYTPSGVDIITYPFG